MKRLSGGLILLNLTNISLDLTGGESTITDESVLQELTELRSFIDINQDFSKGFKNLKPVYIEYRSSASKFNGVALANLNFHTDALHLNIGCLVNNNGKYLNLIINVVYEWDSFIGYKVKTAKLNAYEKTAMTGANITGDADIVGDVDITGDVVIVGDTAITGGFTADSIIENMSGYSFIYSTPSYAEYENVYVGVVKNGNKITFVVAFNVIKRTGNPNTEQYIGTFNIPSEVGAKLFETSYGGINFLFSDYIKAYTLPYSAVDGIAYGRKNSNTQISFTLDGSTFSNMTEDTQYYIRIEKTFLLSENLGE